MELEPRPVFGEVSSSFPQVRVRARVLIVEDDPEMRAFLADVLRGAGYAVELASDGTRAALTLFRGECGASLEDYDLILSDVRMPGLDGVELASEVKRSFGPPVVLVSAFATESVIERASKAGAVAVVSKPFDLSRLLALVNEYAPPEL